MAEYTDLSNYINRSMTGSAGTAGSAETIWLMKNNRVNGAGAIVVAGGWTSLWLYDGIRPTAGATPPTSAESPTVLTTGSFEQTLISGSNQKWINSVSAFSDQPGTFIIYDRLMHVSGLSATSTSVQTVSGSITRYTGAESAGNEIWIEIYTQIGTTAVDGTVGYVNQDGVSKTSQIFSIGATGKREIQRMIRVYLANGDTGVRSIDSVTLGASTGTAGDFGINITRPIMQLHMHNSNFGYNRSFVDGTLIDIKSTACLAIMYLSATALGAARLRACISLAEA